MFRLVQNGVEQPLLQSTGQLTAEGELLMDTFFLVLNQMLMMFSLMVTGFILRKKNLVPEKTDITLAKLETYLFVPALNLYTQFTKCTVQTFAENYVLILYGAVIVVIAILISYPLSALFIKNPNKDSKTDYQRCIYRYAIAFGNIGYVGNFIVIGIWGQDVFYQYSMFSFVISILCSAWGLYTLVPKESGASLKENLKNGLLKAPTISLYIGMFCGLTGLAKYVPDFAITVLSNASNCMGPCAMLLAGIVIGGYEIKGLFMNKKVYIVSVLRLILIPAVFVTALRLMGTDKIVVTLALVLLSTPLGMNTIVYPASFGGDTKTGASMTMISSILSIITIPLMYLIFM